MNTSIENSLSQSTHQSRSDQSFQLCDEPTQLISVDPKFLRNARSPEPVKTKYFGEGQQDIYQQNLYNEIKRETSNQQKKWMKEGRDQRDLMETNNHYKYQRQSKISQERIQDERQSQEICDKIAALTPASRIHRSNKLKSLKLLQKKVQYFEKQYEILKQCNQGILDLLTNIKNQNSFKLSKQNDNKNDSREKYSSFTENDFLASSDKNIEELHFSVHEIKGSNQSNEAQQMVKHDKRIIKRYSSELVLYNQLEYQRHSSTTFDHRKRTNFRNNRDQIPLFSSDKNIHVSVSDQSSIKEEQGIQLDPTRVLQIDQQPLEQVNKTKYNEYIGKFKYFRSIRPNRIFQYRKNPIVNENNEGTQKQEVQKVDKMRDLPNKFQQDSKHRTVSSANQLSTFAGLQSNSPVQITGRFDRFALQNVRYRSILQEKVEITDKEQQLGHNDSLSIKNSKQFTSSKSKPFTSSQEFFDMKIEIYRLKKERDFHLKEILRLQKLVSSQQENDEKLRNLDK